MSEQLISVRLTTMQITAIQRMTADKINDSNELLESSIARSNTEIRNILKDNITLITSIEESIYEALRYN